MSRGFYHRHPRWKELKSLGKKAIKGAIIAEIKKISNGLNHGIQSTRWDQVRPDYLPASLQVKNIFGVSTWGDVLAIAGLESPFIGPNKGKGKRVNEEEANGIMGKLRSAAHSPDYHRRPMVIRYSSHTARPYRYYDPIEHRWIETVAYRGGHFGASGGD